jgi:Galactose oxidase, central domain
MNKYVILLILSVYAFKVEQIPSQGSPPPKYENTASVYDNITNSIYIIGGLDSETSKAVNEINVFSLSTLTWSIITPESDYVPEGFQQHSLYINNNREILVLFGMSNSRYIKDVYIFNIEKYEWSVKQIDGDIITGRIAFSSTSFYYANIYYVAVYGGFDRNGYDTNLYL